MISIIIIIIIKLDFNMRAASVNVNLRHEVIVIERLSKGLYTVAVKLLHY